MKSIKLINDTFKYNIKLIIAESDKQFDSEIVKLNKIEDLCIRYTSKDYNGFFTYSEVTGERFILINGYNILVLTHELIHGVFHMLHDRGVETRIENDEVFAYSFENFLKQALVLFKNK